MVVVILTSSVYASECPQGIRFWRLVNGHPNISLPYVHAGNPDTMDEAVASTQAAHASQGSAVRLSSYGTAQGGTTCLCPSLARALLELAQNASVGVEEFAGGSHPTATSPHYRGLAMDISSYDGRPLKDQNAEGVAMVQAACVRRGAMVVKQHDTGSVHCEWSQKHNEEEL